MPLTTALVDEARIIRSVASAVKVEGRTQFAFVTLPWFRCRVTIQAKQRGPHPSPDGTGRAEFTPSMMTGIKDRDGNPLDLSIRDRVEVRSPSLGLEEVVFEVTADPKPIRKKRTVIGYTTTLKKIEAHAFEEPVA